jgi:two-component system phosphate regulon response regulator PhoB
MSTGKKHILLVDDERGLRQLLLTTLAAPDFAIAQAASGEQALQLARELQPDLIILDMHLTPEHPNGIEVCRQLKTDPVTAGGRVLMLTAAGRAEDRQAAERAGADYYFTKPFSPRQLLDQIYALLG